MNDSSDIMPDERAFDSHKELHVTRAKNQTAPSEARENTSQMKREIKTIFPLHVQCKGNCNIVVRTNDE